MYTSNCEPGGRFRIHSTSGVRKVGRVLLFQHLLALLRLASRTQRIQISANQVPYHVFSRRLTTAEPLELLFGTLLDLCGLLCTNVQDIQQVVKNERQRVEHERGSNFS